MVLTLDNAGGSHVAGMDALFRFFCASLRSIYRDRLFRDFVQFVAAEAADNTPGVEVRFCLLAPPRPRVAVSRCLRL